MTRRIALAWLVAAALPPLACSRPSGPSAGSPASAPADSPPRPPAPPAASLLPAAPAGSPPSEGGASPGLNVLKNPGFEAGREPWTRMGTENWGAFDIVGAPTHSGTAAARLVIRAPAGQATPPSRVFGVVQEVRAEELPGGFPETIGGWYRVDRWGPHPPEVFQYLQVVVIAWGDPRAEKLSGTPGIQNYQIRFMLAGSATQPFQLSNAHYDFISREPPRVGEWVRFEIPVRKRFQELWGVVPENFEFLRILYEGRWDSRPATADIDAEVLYDDLFFGYGRPPESP